MYKRQLQHADVRDDADHDGAHHQANTHECDEHQADGVHDVGHRTHDDAHVVGVRDRLLIVAGGFDLLVVRIDVIEYALLGLKVARENLNRDGVCLIRIAQRGQIVVVGELRSLGIAHHERTQVLGVHVEVNGMSKKEIIVSNVSEEHNNPIAELVQVACRFDSEIILESDNRRINAKSIMGIMAFNPSKGMTVNIEANGEDEQEALVAMEKFLVCE